MKGFLTIWPIWAAKNEQTEKYTFIDEIRTVGLFLDLGESIGRPVILAQQQLTWGKLVFQCFW